VAAHRSADIQPSYYNFRSCWRVPDKRLPLFSWNPKTAPGCTARIAERFDAMLAGGFLDEVRRCARAATCRPSCRRCARGLPPGLGRRWTKAGRWRCCASGASPPRASWPSASSPGCAACRGSATDPADRLPPPSAPPHPSVATLTGLSALLATGLAGCGGGGDAEAPAPGQPPAPGESPAPLPPAVPFTATEAARFLQQAQFSSSEADIAAVRATGPARWLDEQMNAPSHTSGWDWLVQQGYQQESLRFNGGYADHMMWNQLIAAPDAVRKRVALAWSEILVVSGLGIDGYWPSFAMAAYWDLLNQHAFGNFRQLLQAITLNPAMGAYLNTRGNLKEDPATGRVPDENYAREVMQLFTIGLYQLNPDGTHVAMASGQPGNLHPGRRQRSWRACSPATTWTPGGEHRTDPTAVSPSDEAQPGAAWSRRHSRVTRVLAPEHRRRQQWHRRGCARRWTSCSSTPTSGPSSAAS
jgi:hypothetical protein